MYTKAAKLNKLHYYTNITKDFRSDLHWWHIFVNNWNGISFFESIHPLQQMPLAHGVVEDALTRTGSRHLRVLNRYPPPCYSCPLQSWIGLYHPLRRSSSHQHLHSHHISILRIQNTYINDSYTRIWQDAI